MPHPCHLPAGARSRGSCSGLAGCRGSRCCNSGALDEQLGRRPSFLRLLSAPGASVSALPPLAQGPIHLELKLALGSLPSPPWDPSGASRKVPMPALPASRL